MNNTTYRLVIVCMCSILMACEDRPSYYVNNILFRDPQTDAVALLCGGIGLEMEGTPEIDPPTVWILSGDEWKRSTVKITQVFSPRYSCRDDQSKSVLFCSGGKGFSGMSTRRGWTYFPQPFAPRQGGEAYCLLFNVQNSRFEFYDLRQKRVWYVDDNGWRVGADDLCPVLNEPSCVPISNIIYHPENHSLVFLGRYADRIFMTEIDIANGLERKYEVSAICFSGRGVLVWNGDSASIIAIVADSREELRLFRYEDGVVEGVETVGDGPRRRSGFTAIYDDSQECIVIFGGYGMSSAFGFKEYTDTWTVRTADSDEQYHWTLIQ